jgi:hypothetical protein
VSVKDTQGFAKVWTHNGLAMVINDVAIQFATDYANVVINNFIRLCEERSIAAQQKALAEAAPKITLEG